MSAAQAPMGVTCDWMTAGDEESDRLFPDAAAFHAAHGDDLAACDDWRCTGCGNTPVGAGFIPCDEGGEEVFPPPLAPDGSAVPWVIAFYLCDGCARLLRPSGRLHREAR